MAILLSNYFVFDQIIKSIDKKQNDLSKYIYFMFYFMHGSINTISTQKRKHF